MYFFENIEKPHKLDLRLTIGGQFISTVSFFAIILKLKNSLILELIN